MLHLFVLGPETFDLQLQLAVEQHGLILELLLETLYLFLRILELLILFNRCAIIFLL